MSAERHRAFVFALLLGLVGALLAACGGGGSGAAGCTLLATPCATVSADCRLQPLAPGTLLPDPAPGDCQKRVCDGSGNAVDAAADADLPNDGNVCTQDLCAAGVPSHPPASTSTPCPGGGTCDGAGGCPTAPLNGCTRAGAADLTAQAAVTITFPVGAAVQYSQPCIAVTAGAAVTFAGAFALHPLTGGTMAGGVGTPATSGPFAGTVSSGTSAAFTVPAGTWPYYCAVHGGLGMMGVVYAAP